jgi:hypothetical protein
MDSSFTLLTPGSETAAMRTHELKAGTIKVGFSGITDIRVSVPSGFLKEEVHVKAMVFTTEFMGGRALAGTLDQPEGHGKSKTLYLYAGKKPFDAVVPLNIPAIGDNDHVGIRYEVRDLRGNLLDHGEFQTKQAAWQARDEASRAASADADDYNLGWDSDWSRADWW